MEVFPAGRKTMFFSNPIHSYLLFQYTSPRYNPLPWLKKGSRARVCNSFPSGASNPLHSSLLHRGEGDEKFTTKLLDTPQEDAAMTSWRRGITPQTPSLLFFFTCSWIVLDKPRPPKILDDEVVNYLFRNFGAYPHPHEIYAQSFDPNFPTADTLLIWISPRNPSSSPQTLVPFLHLPIPQLLAQHSSPSPISSSTGDAWAKWSPNYSYHPVCRLLLTFLHAQLYEGSTRMWHLCSSKPLLALSWRPLVSPN